MSFYSVSLMNMRSLLENTKGWGDRAPTFESSVWSCRQNETQ